MNSKTNRKPLTEAEQEQAAYRDLAKARELIEKHQAYIPNRYYVPITDAFNEWISHSNESLLSLIPRATIARLLAAGSEEVMKDDGEIENTDRKPSTTDSQVIH